MENRNVGWLILSLAAIIAVIIFLFNTALHEIVRSSCGLEHSLVCPMNQTITQQTYLSLAIVAILAVIGLFLLFAKPQERLIVKRIKDKKIDKNVDLSSFRPEEKKVYALVKENGTIFQADLIEKTGFGKAKVSRIIDRLEGKGLVERKRRGMTNVVVLKD